MLYTYLPLTPPSGHVRRGTTRRRHEGEPHETHVSQAAGPVIVPPISHVHVRNVAIRVLEGEDESGLGVVRGG